MSLLFEIQPPTVSLREKVSGEEIYHGEEIPIASFPFHASEWTLSNSALTMDLDTFSNSSSFTMDFTQCLWSDAVEWQSTIPAVSDSGMPDLKKSTQVRTKVSLLHRASAAKVFFFYNQGG